MKSKQCPQKEQKKNIASIALWRAKRREQCKRMAQEEISHQKAIEELDRVLLREFKAFI
ncbi:TPA: hypothetical protein RPO84_004347 [Escherichia coli]|nr:hypothetical protein [Escherichia coli]